VKNLIVAFLNSAEAHTNEIFLTTIVFLSSPSPSVPLSASLEKSHLHQNLHFKSHEQQRISSTAALDRKG
jgi:hypothetical protein